jgi:hypothetical protein
MASVTDSSKRHGAMGVDFLYSYLDCVCMCIARGDAPLSGALVLNVLGLTRPARAGLELTTSRMLSESTSTRLRQLVI